MLMLTSKQRKILEAKAIDVEAIFQIGKNGVSENLINALKDALKSRELIKISMLRSFEEDPRATADSLALALSAETVAVRGNKIIIYKFSEKEGIKHILGD